MFNIQSKNRDPSVDPPRLIANAIGRTTVFYRFVGASSNPTPPLPTHDCIVAQDQQQLSSINVTLLPNTHTLSGQTEDSPPLRIDHTRSLRWRRKQIARRVQGTLLPPTNSTTKPVQDSPSSPAPLMCCSNSFGAFGAKWASCARG